MNAHLDPPQLGTLETGDFRPSFRPGAASVPEAGELAELGARLSAGPLALARATRRTRRTARFLVGCAGHIRRELLAEDTPGQARQAYAGFMAENICALNGFDVRVSGPLPGAGQPALLVCNHIGWQDAILINAVVPSLAVVKREVASWPLVSDIARGLGYLFVDRGDAHSGAQVLLRARRELEAGCSVLTFPEGTTTQGKGVLPLHRGMFGLSKLSGFPVVPISLCYALGPGAAWVGDDTFLPHFAKTVAREATVSYLDFGAPMHARPDESAEAFGARVRDQILAQLQARRDDLELS